MSRKNTQYVIEHGKVDEAKSKESSANLSPDEVIARSLSEMSKAMQRLAVGPLRLKAITILLHHQTKLPMRDIDAVIKGLGDLERIYCK